VIGTDGEVVRIVGTIADVTDERRRKSCEIRPRRSSITVSRAAE
jgi:hypothetical protein